MHGKQLSQKTETAEESKQTIKNSPSNAKSILQNAKKKGQNIQNNRKTDKQKKMITI